MSALQLQSGAGLLALCLLAWAIGGCRRPVPWRIVAAGLLGVVGLAALLLRVPPLRAAFDWAGSGVEALARATRVGTALVFGHLGGGPLPYAETAPGASFVLFFQALPLVLVVGALSALLYHWRVLPVLVGGMSRALRRLFGLSGACGFAVAANVFLGMVEAPLLIRAWLGRLSRAELFAVMVSGLATISGNTLVLYAAMLAPVLPDAAGQLLAASLVGAPASVLAAFLMMPPAPAAERPGFIAARPGFVAARPGSVAARPGSAAAGPGSGAEAGSGAAPAGIADAAPDATPYGGSPGGPDDAPPAAVVYDGAVDAIVRGTAEGLQLLLGIMAMLIVFVALVALANEVLTPLTGLTLQQVAGWGMTPLAWLMGIPAEQAGAAGRLLGVKVVVNEFVAYLDLAGGAGAGMDPRSRLILAWALCGFTNFGSVGIMVGGMTAMCPERRAEIAALGLPALACAVLACAMMGAAVGLLTPPG